MGELEDMMFMSIKNVLKVSVDTYYQGKRTDWVLEHCGQCVLNGSQVHWTTEVETAIKEKKLEEYVDFLQQQLLGCVELVRHKLSKLQSITMSALITIDVHAKDVVEKLKKLKMDDIGGFEWIS